MNEPTDKPGYYYRGDRPEMVGYVPIDATRILEVGCGDGGFGAQIKATRDAEVWGIEPHQAAASLAWDRIDKTVVGQFARSLALPAGYFDCIVFNDVLEHLVDPFDALDYCRELLRPHGVVVASIPNLRHASVLLDLCLRGRFTYMPAGILDRTHLRFFTRDSILRMFADCGYRVRSIEGINPSRSRKFEIANLLLMKRIDDIRYEQFAVVAEPT